MLSVASTVPSEYPFLQSDPIDVKPNTAEQTDNAMDLDVQMYSHPPASQTDEATSISRAPSLHIDVDVDVPHNVVTQPNGVVIIEKLDTPAIRRERNNRRRAEKRKLADHAPLEQNPASAPSSSISVRQPSSPRPNVSALVSSELQPLPDQVDEDTGDVIADEDFGSDLSELSDESDNSEEADGVNDMPPQEPIPPPLPPKKTTIPTRRKKLPKGEIYEDGTIGRLFKKLLVTTSV